MPSWAPHPETLEHAEGWIGVAGEPDRRIAYTAAVDAIYRHPFGAAAEGVEPGLEATRYWRIGNIYHQPEKQGRFSTYPTWPNGMAACVVEVDPETGLVRLLRWLLVEDAGVIVNPLLAEANLHGAIAQGIGSALYERIAYDAAGQLLTATLMDYTHPHRGRGARPRDRPPRHAQPLHAPGHQGRGRVGHQQRPGRHRRRDRGRLPRAGPAPRAPAPHPRARLARPREAPPRAATGGREARLDRPQAIASG